MTKAQVVDINSPIQDYLHPGDQTQPTFHMTLRFKPFTKKKQLIRFRRAKYKHLCSKTKPYATLRF